MNRIVVGISLALVTAACGPQPSPGGTGGTGGSNSNPFCEVKRVLDSKCIGCHADTPNSGAPMPLTSYAATQRISLSGQPYYALIGSRVGSKTMPPASEVPLTDADRTLLVNWANAGGPGSECPSSGIGTCDTNPNFCVGPQRLPCQPDVFITAHARGDFTQKYPIAANARDRYNCYRFTNPFYNTNPVKYEVAEAPIIDNAAVIHHWLLFGSYSGTNGDIDDATGNCVGPELSDTLISGWAPGGTNSVYPSDIGLALNQWPILTLQVHYNNLTPNPTADASGVAYCTTTNTPAHIAGSVTLGQDVGINVPPNAYNTLGGSGTCTNMFAAGSGTATIINSWAHMHRLGSGFTTDLLRNGQHVRYVTNVPMGTWAFDKQIHYPHTELGDGRIDVLPGDVLQTNCYYTNTTGTQVTFGPKTSDEMCYDFLIAYPISQLKRGCGNLLVSFRQ